MSDLNQQILNELPLKNITVNSIHFSIEHSLPRKEELLWDYFGEVELKDLWLPDQL